MLFFAVTLNVLTALAYVLLGPVVIPRLLRSFNLRLRFLLHVCLGMFFIGCALTHGEIVLHLLGDGEKNAAHHAILAIPQVIGGYAVILFAVLDRRWRTPTGVLDERSGMMP